MSSKILNIFFEHSLGLGYLSQRLVSSRFLSVNNSYVIDLMMSENFREVKFYIAKGTSTDLTDSFSNVLSTGLCANSVQSL